ncbi:MAG: ABC-F family ATP-binding cassette domain-containing protein [Anaerolineales bacterium]
MSILSAKNLGLSFGAFDLFRGISVTIANDSKIGLIGPNGIGKTSLMMILAGLNQPTSGWIHIARGKRLGYLRQEASDTLGKTSGTGAFTRAACSAALARDENTVYAEMLTVFTGLQEQQAALHKLEADMAGGCYTEEVLTTYGDLQAAFEHAGGYDYDLRIQQTLQGLGLGKQTWEMPLSHLSGGQKTRLLLARLLLENPALLMLDEPTNHLDAEAIEWLEHTLNEWEGAVLVASHDRYFLDNTVSTIWEMSHAGIELYTGNYSNYLLQRDVRWEYAERVFEEEKERLQKEMDFVQRNWVRASTHARALGTLRKVTRELAAVDAHGIMVLRSGRNWHELDLRADKPLDVIEAIRKVNALEMPGRPPMIRPRLVPSTDSSNIILRAENAVIGYPGQRLFQVQHLELRRAECAALIGPNGSGKTTFLKTMLGQVEPLVGETRLGASLEIGYFAQAHDDLIGENSVLDELLRSREMDAGHARSHLAQYLFRGDDVFKPVSALSGGERGRLALAILALCGANFLLLDEPTNHLDLPAREILQQVLQDYRGTILLVSHDRYLIDQLASQIWELREGRLNVFNGTYRQFVLQRSGTPSQAQRMLLPAKPLVRDNSQGTRRLQQALEKLEQRIREQEQAVQRISQELHHASGSKGFEMINDLSWKYAKAQAELEKLTHEWEKLVEKA